ncbi:unnamed protein product [Chrysoparadoxa australica]
MDFDGNLERVQRSIRNAKHLGATYRLGPELELCGYGCEDHFMEPDTFLHCNQSLAAILSSDLTDDILCDIGMPVLHRNVRYNCRVFCLNRKILLIRPKLFLADDGNYRETRYFTSWKKSNTVEDHLLAPLLQGACGQTVVPFGQAAISAMDTMIAAETCEELWTPASPHIGQCLGGVEVIGNGSGSHHQLRKLDTRVKYMLSCTWKCGGVYLYANQRGCDGSRLYYDGSALIVCNGKLLAQASQFSLIDVEVISATIDLDEVRSYRASCSSLQEQSSCAASICTVPAPGYWLTSHGRDSVVVTPSQPLELRIHSPEEECGLGPACWLWDYMRRSGAAGFFLPLSGGADSSSSAVIVGIMCHLALDAAKGGDETVKADLLRITGREELPTSYRDVAGDILHTAYMGTENSSAITSSRAAKLAHQIGAYHSRINIDTIVQAVLGVFSALTGKSPRFESNGGNMCEDLALQNIQARIRMLMAYLLAQQLLPWVRGTMAQGYLLVLGSANVDEALRGYMTKYDCSSADLNPIGAISKVDLKRLLSWAATEYDYDVLSEIVAAPPTAELRPQENSGQNSIEHSQEDEDDMGMTYEELSSFGRLRKVSNDLCGPVSMFKKLVHVWKEQSIGAVAEKVKRFFHFYGINRHKLTTLTPSYHAEQYSPDDNRFDLRQFLYPRWTRQFRDIDTLVADSKKQQ